MNSVANHCREVGPASVITPLSHALNGMQKCLISHLHADCIGILNLSGVRKLLNSL